QPGGRGDPRPRRGPPLAFQLAADQQPQPDHRGRRRASRDRIAMATIPHPRQIQVAVVDWLDKRFPFTETVDEALYQRVPNYANAFYYCFGGMVFMLIVFLLLTGVFLAFYYTPDASGNPAPSYTSVKTIMSSVYLGWLVRGAHFWSANLLVVMIVMH